jgi:glutamate dehydrogenase/leucine dehydrogenase
MGLSPEHADVINERFSRNITGGFKSKIGPTGKPTAHGVYLAVKAAAEYLFKSDQLQGKTIAVQGLGAVGWYLAEYYLQAGANLIITDTNKATTQEFINKHEGSSNIRVVEPAEILFTDADIFSPAAVGGIITEEIIGSFKFKIILGAANNTIKASGAEEEFRIARILKERGILFQVDWVHNIGGVLAGWDEYLNKQNSSFENIQPIIEKLCPANTLYNLREAEKRGITPTEVAYQTIENQIYK